ncbi:gap junction delta-4 protein [Spinachia spinachia]
MTGMSGSEVIFISVNLNITLMGKVWLVVMIFLRILILLLAGYPLYQDEQERFVCNTIQPGCANVCYDLFSPISLFRFWLVQLVTLCLPYFIFIIYVVHKVLKDLTADPYPSRHTNALPLLENHQELFDKSSVNKMAERGGTRCFTGAYILHLLFRTLLEAGFGAAHYYLFGFHIPRRFLCQHPPCTTQVDCYISRPTEKTAMLNFMLGAAALSLFLNVLDFFCAIKRSVKQKSKSRVAVVEKIYDEEQCFLLGRGDSKGQGQEPNPSPAKQEQEEASLPGSFRKRRGSKGSSPGLALGQETPVLERSSLPHSAGHPGCNTNRNNAYSVSQEEALERNGSEVALCPPEAMRTPRSIRVSKRSRLKPPPPPRRDLGASPREPAVPLGDVSTAICTRRVGQYTLVELGIGAQPQTNEEEIRSEWV